MNSYLYCITTVAGEVMITRTRHHLRYPLKGNENALVNSDSERIKLR